MHTGCSGLDPLNFYLGPFFLSRGHELLWTILVCYTFPDSISRDVYCSVGKRAAPWDTMRVLRSAFWDEALRDSCNILTQPS